MWKYYSICSLLCIIINVVHGHGPKSFDDTVFYTINWPGVNRDILESRHHGEPYIITTANKEMYLCLIINNTEPEQDYKGPYRGVGPMELLTPLFEQTSCVYKVESYWSYELCHGQYVRQYHEGRDGKKVKIQEYYLGRFSNEQLRKLFMEYTKKAASPTKRTDIPVKKLNGVAMPYVEVEMTDGSYCELTNKQRKVKVLYVCYPHSIHEYFKIEEPSSCEYEIVVLTSVLCYHPDYKPRVAGQNEINCYPVDNAPKKPKALTAMEMESLKLRNQKVTDDKLQKAYAIFHVDKEGQDSEVPGRVEIHPVGVIDKHNNIEDSINSLADQGISPADISPVKNFLSGNNCLHGGNGWWKYEFCYGRSVVQYHIERDGKKTIVNLGTFDKQKHLEWIAAHPHKRPKSPELRKPLSHFYSDGTVCDKTGNRRQTEVKLKCVESETGSPSSVSLFLLEPKTCEYVLGVESPLICAILEYADENGLLSEKFEVNFDKLKTTAFHEYDDLDERIANGDD